ncbi:multicopper oxidase family protein [Phaeobacter sp. PT47_59]|uniref:multicopper oxidase family protein n=1 Tax=Phaeobacter sp. PT47_59 TaxID=3029979 RepID=UPI0023805DE8|nr:multicopper oxidase family protein [Phaeobacter sp. PT47_59]MDE4176095.1 multicopper oxidase family protein [Phaeobacter sp. PT47_59]
MPTRRSLLAGLATLPLLPRMGLSASAPHRLRLAPAPIQIAPAQYGKTDLWGVNGSVPGPALRARRGERLRVEIDNALPQATSMHWHGIRIENAMDGVPGLTQDPIATGEVFTYDFALPDAGTYWYHSHAQSVEQVERGLQGPLIIAEDEAPDVDQDLVLMLDDIRLAGDASVDAQFTHPHDRSHAGRLGNVMLTNGQMEASFPVTQGERLRLRLINSANARIFALGLQGLTGWIMAYDGMPLPTPEAIPERMLLAPAQRIDLIVDVSASAGEDAFLIQFERDGGYAQAIFPVSAGTSTTRGTPAPLPPNPDHPIELSDADTVTLRMEGGAMGGMQSAQWQGKAQGMRALAQAGQFWAFNGVVGRPDKPLVRASLGQTVKIAMVNDTSFPHAMHLHGMHFAEVLPDGSLGPLRDTLLMMRGETRTVAFNAHNPGKWLLHCHMLSHHAAGMGTWVEVVA